MDGYREYPDKVPTFKVSHQSFAVILKNINYGPEDDDSNIPAAIENGTTTLLRFLDNPEGRSSREIAGFLGLASINVATKKIKPLIERGLVERTVPDAVRSKNQRYRTSKTGKESLKRSYSESGPESSG